MVLLETSLVFICEYHLFFMSLAEHLSFSFKCDLLYLELNVYDVHKYYIQYITLLISYRAYIIPAVLITL